MPCIAAFAVARITQWFVLQPERVEAHGSSVGNQLLAIGGDEMRHRPSLPDVAVQPETAGHCVHHSIAAPLELTPSGPGPLGGRRRDY